MQKGRQAKSRKAIVSIFIYFFEFLPENYNFSFCKSKSPSIQSTKPIKLMFLSDKKDSSGSATCTIECVGSTPAPTPSPPTTTTGTVALNRE